MTHLVSISKISSGHWKVVVERYNYSRTMPVRVTSITRWVHVTTDSVSIDNYYSGSESKAKSAEKSLVRSARWFGRKEYERN